MDGYYFRTGKLYKDRVCVRPIEHHYEETGQHEYIKYGCPVCEKIGARHSLEYGTSNCPLCGVNLLWHRNKEG